jgi:hypothetical protein
VIERWKMEMDGSSGVIMCVGCGRLSALSTKTSSEGEVLGLDGDTWKEKRKRVSA